MSTRQLRRQIARKGSLPKVGFTVIPRNGVRSRRIQLAHVAKLAKECHGKTEKELRIAGLPFGQEEFREELAKRIRRELPSVPMVRNHRIKPSKSDNPSYRKPNVLKHLREGGGV